MKKTAEPIVLPASYNYIGVFLTFDCKLGCSYCINNFEEKVKNRGFISGKDWVKCLNRLVSRPDMPISLQGGEPSLHPDFIYIINNIKPELNIDFLTNLNFDIDGFMKKVKPDRIKRDAPYASIRVSFHPQKMKIEILAARVKKMLDNGYSIGVWGVKHPDYQVQIEKAGEICAKLGIDFRVKEFLGEYNGRLYGTYKYPEACEKKNAKEVFCRASELLIDPQARSFRCHHDIYKNTNSIGSLLDFSWQLDDIWRSCSDYGFCNPCDIKVKTNRLQQSGHTSVEIKMTDKIE